MGRRRSIAVKGRRERKQGSKRVPSAKTSVNSSRFLPALWSSHAAIPFKTMRA